MSETPAPLELTVTEDPITGTWTFTLHGHRIEVQRTHGFIKIDTIIHDAPLVQGLTDIQDLAGGPLDYIHHLLSTTTAPAPLMTPRTAQLPHQVIQQPGPIPTRTNEPSHEQPRPAERPTPAATAPPSEQPITAKRARRPRPQMPATQPTTPPGDAPAGSDHVVLTTDQAATYLGLSPTTLETLRTRGGGPPFVKLGRRVVYRSEDLATWLAHRVRRSTSDPGLG